MTGPAKPTAGPTKSEAEAPKSTPPSDGALATAAKSSGGTDEIGRDATQVVKDLADAGTPPTPSTASGLAAIGSPEGTETAKTTQANSDVQAEAGGHKPQVPIGDQTTAAFFTRDGSIPGGTVPSPSGPVPASTIHDEATRDAAVKAAREGAVSPHLRKNSRFRISEHAARQMGPAALRAVAHDRGYEGVDGGRAAQHTKFMAAQAKDDSLVDPPEGHHLAAQPVQPIPLGDGVAAGAAVSGNPLVTGTPTPLGSLSNTDGTAAQIETPRSAVTTPEPGLHFKGEEK